MGRSVLAKVLARAHGDKVAIARRRGRALERDALDAEDRLVLVKVVPVNHAECVRPGGEELQGRALVRRRDEVVAHGVDCDLAFLVVGLERNAEVRGADVVP